MCYGDLMTREGQEQETPQPTSIHSKQDFKEMYQNLLLP